MNGLLTRGRGVSSYLRRSAGRRYSPRFSTITPNYPVEQLEPRVLLTATPTISGNTAVNEGTSYTLNLTANSNSTVQYWDINWGDGTSVERVTGNASSRTHAYADGPARYNLAASVTDTDGTYPATPLVLDGAFDSDGKVTTDFSATDTGRAVAVQPDGKVIVAGNTSTSGGVFTVARYNTDGTLDTSFDSDGKLTFSAQANSAATAVHVLSDGKILVGGYFFFSTILARDFAIYRLNPNGSLDTTFGTGSSGSVKTNFGSQGGEIGSGDFAYAMALQSDGKIVLAGTTNITGSGGGDIALARYTSAGALDTSFDTDGKLTTNLSGIDIAYGVAIQSDGKIVVAGESGGNFALARYSSTGALDTSFDSDGKLTTDIGASDDGARGVAIQADGKIVVAGHSGGNFALARYSGSDGSLDTSFGTGGKLTTDMGASDDSANGIRIDANGRLVVAGGSGGNFALARYNSSDGSLDSSFAPGGKYTVDFGGTDFANALTLDTAGRVVTVGESSGDYAVARIGYLGVDNVAPTVDAGPDKSGIAGQPVTLDGTFDDASDADTHTLAWTVKNALNVTVATGTSASITFTPLARGSYTATLVVTDDDTGIGSDSATITVAGRAPVVNPMTPINISEGGTAHLAGSYSDPDPDDTHTLAWSVKDSANTVVASGSGATLDFVPTDNGTFIGTFTVTDGDVLSDSEPVIITATNAVPVVDAGPDKTATRGQPVSLTGSATDPGSADTLSYAWVITNEQGQTVATGSTPTITFTPPIAGRFTATLTATDDDTGSASDSAVITAGVPDVETTEIDIENHSFEDVSALADGATMDVVPGWDDSIPDGIPPEVELGGYGPETMDPASSDFDAVDGENVANVYKWYDLNETSNAYDGYIAQTLGATYQSDSEYTLTFDERDNMPGGVGPGQMGLYGLIAADTDYVDREDGWRAYTITFDGDDSRNVGQLGSPLTVVFTMPFDGVISDRLTIDDVHLTATRPLPTVDLDLAGVDDDDEESVGGFISLNFDFDEDNHDRRGRPLRDNKADFTAGARALEDDEELRPATLFLSGVPGSWNLAYPDSVLVWRVNEDDSLTLIPNGQAFPASPAGEIIDLRIEGIGQSPSVRGTQIKAHFQPTGAGDPVEDVVKVTVANIELVLDGDNDNATNTPDFSDGESRAARDPGGTGKIVYVNADDNDNDNIDDYLDGFNLDGTASTGDDATMNEKFVTMPIIAPNIDNLNFARFHIDYAADDPLTTGTVEGPLRLWKLPGDQPRDGHTPATSGGSWIAPGTYTAAQLGIDWNYGMGTLWIEAVAATSGLSDPDRKIEITFDIDGDGPAPASEYTDAVYVTAIDAGANIPGTISGYKWNDVNGNHVRDMRPVVDGDAPEVVYVIDVSGSTLNPYIGNSISSLTADVTDDDDINDDGHNNTILDGEIAGVLALNEDLIGRLLGADTSVSVVLFGTTAALLDLDLDTPGVQSVLTLDATDAPKVAEALKSVRSGGAESGPDVGGSTYYSAGLGLAETALNTLAPEAGDGNVIFLSDGFPDDPGTYADEATRLRGAVIPSSNPLQYEVNVRAFGAGRGADLAALEDIDPDPAIFITTDQILTAFDGLGTGSTQDPLEPLIPYWTIFLDADEDGALDPGERSTTTDAYGNYIFTDVAPGTYIVAEGMPAGWEQTYPLTQTHSVTVSAGEQETGWNFGNVQASPDLDIDSDNDGTLQRSQGEDDIEISRGLPGKIVSIHNTDEDVDGIPDYVDLDVAGQSFTPLVLDLGDFFSLDNLKIRFAYDGSDPTAQHGLTPAAGNLRIWRKDGDEARALGDYIKPQTTYTPLQLGLDADTSEVTLWVEGTRATATDVPATIQVMIDDGLGYGFSVVTLSDAVNVTVEEPTVTNRPPEFTVVPPPGQGFSLNPDDPAPPAPPVTDWQRGEVFLSVGNDVIRRFVIDANGDYVLHEEMNFGPENNTELNTGMAFDKLGNLYAAGYDGRVGHFLPSGEQTSDFGLFGGFLPLRRPQGVAVDQFNNVYVTSDIVYTGFVPFDPPYALVKFSPDGQATGYFMPQNSMDRITIAPDQHTLYYTRKVDLGVAEPSTEKKLFRMDLNDRGTPEVFFTSPLENGHTAFADIRALPDGDVLVSDIVAKRIWRIHPDGTVDDRIYGDGLDDFGAISLDPDGTSFWAASSGHRNTYTPKIYRFDLASGRLIQFLDVGELFPGDNGESTELSGMTVYGETAHVLEVDRIYETQLMAVDPDGDQVVYSIVGDAHGATIDPISGAFTWRPTAAGQYDFTIRATDPSDAYDDHVFSVTVGIEDPTNHAPLIQTTSLSDAFVGRDYQNAVLATDADGDPLTYSLINTTNFEINPQTGALRWTPSPADRPGPRTVTVKVSDPRGGSDQQSYDIDIVPEDAGNRAPVFTSSSVHSAVVGQPFTGVLRVDDSTEVYAVLLSGPAGLTLHGSGLTFTMEWTPTEAQLGTHNVLVRFADLHGGMTTGLATITVTESGHPFELFPAAGGFAYEGTPWDGELAVLVERSTDANNVTYDPTSAEDYEVWIDWGNGNVEPGRISTSDLPTYPWRRFSIRTTHTFHGHQRTPFAVYVRYKPTGLALRTASTIDIYDGPIWTVDPRRIQAIRGVEFTEKLGQFTDSDLSGKPEDWRAIVDWGDAGGAITEASVVRAPNGKLDVIGTYTYLNADLSHPDYFSATVFIFASDKPINETGLGAASSIPVTVDFQTQEVDAPLHVHADGISPDEIEVTWDIGAGIAGYILTRKDLATGVITRDPESYGAVLTPQPGETTTFHYHDGSLAPHSDYEYSITAVDEDGDISPPTIVTGTTLDNLPKPGNLVATANSGSEVLLTWDTSEDPAPDGWDVLRATSASGPFHSILPPGQMTPTNSFHDEGTEPETHYWYKVVAIDAQGRRSVESDAADATTLQAPGLPAPPTDLEGAYAGSGRVGLRWAHVPGAGLLGFDVYRSTSADFIPSGATLIGSSIDRRYTDDGVSGTVYYRVVAVSEDGASLPSNMASVDTTITVVEPNAPSDIVAVAVSRTDLAADHVHVSWTDNALNETGYLILRREWDPTASPADFGAELTIGRVTADATSFDDTDVFQGAKYRYRVAAVNGTEPTTHVVPSVTFADVTLLSGQGTPNVPTGLTVFDTAYNTVVLHWTPDWGATGYFVYRKTSGGVGYVRLNNTPISRGALEGSREFVDTTVDPETTYSYVIRAHNDAARSVSAPTDPVTATTDEAPDSAPVVRFTSPVTTGPSYDPRPWEIKSATQIRGLVDDLDEQFKDWTLSLRPVNLGATAQGANPEIVLRTGNTTLGSDRGNVDDVLFNLDPSFYPSGTYDVVLTARDWPLDETEPTEPDEYREVSITRRVNLSSDIKLGNLTLPFTDLSVNVPGGRPITVTRVYDSQSADILGDFGIGWRLDLSDTGLHTNGRPSRRGSEPASQTPILRQGDLVYITLPGGDQRAFAFVPRPLNYNPGSLGSGYNVYYTYKAQFVAVDGGRATLSVDGDSDGSPFELRRDGDEYFGSGINFAEIGYNPARSQFGQHYYLTMEDGTRYTINAASGKITSSTDPNGNTTTYGDGSAGSGGAGVEINRAGNRIEWIADQRDTSTGHRITYTYYSDDSNSPAYHRLWKVLDERTGAQTEFLYDTTDPAHPNRLIGIIDPRGVRTLTAEYSPVTGELTALSGPAAPAPAQIAGGGFDGTRARQAVTDLEGNQTEMVYDRRGNVTREIKFIPGVDESDPGRYLVTVKTYRFVEENRLDVIDLGVSNYNQPLAFKEWAPFEVPGPDIAGTRFSMQPPTNPLRVTTFYDFDPSDAGQDPNDPNVGMPFQTSVLNPNYGFITGAPQYLTTTYGNYFRGKPGMVTDPYGRITRMTFDSAGNVLTTINPIGEGTEYVYSDSLRRTDLPAGLLLETWRVWDDDNNPATRPVRLTSVSDVTNDYFVTSNTSTGAVRASLWKTTDNRTGVTTRYTYMPDGQVKETFREWTENSVSHSVRESLTTYDAAGRVVASTSFPNPTLDSDGETTQTHYDTMGRVDWTKDSFGGYTINTYDVRGNLIRTLYPDGTETRTAFDDMGRTVWTMERFASSTSASVNSGTGAITITSNDSTSTAIVSHTTYDAAGRVISTERFKQAAIRLSTQTVDTIDFLKSELTVAGTQIATTATVFDQQGRVVETTDASGLRSGSVFYPDGRVHYAGPLDPDAPLISDGDETNWFEDADPLQYFLLPDIDPDSNPATDNPMVTTYVYDVLVGDQLTDTVTDARGNTTTTYKDKLGRVVKTLFADNSFTETIYGGHNAAITDSAYDPPTTGEGWPTGGVPAGGQHVVKIEQRKTGDAIVATHYLYDSSGRLVDVWQPAVDDATTVSSALVRPHWHYIYDANGNQKTQVDPNSHTTSFAYDEQNRRTSRMLPPDGDSDTSDDTETWTYDARGRVDVHVDFKGQSTQYVYDDTAAHGGRIDHEDRFAAAVDSDSDENTYYMYDALGRRDTVTDFDGATQTDTYYQYDPVTGAEVMEGGPNGTVRHQYDPATGRLTATWVAPDPTEVMTIEDAETEAYALTTYEYNYLGQLWHVTAARMGDTTPATPQVTTYVYDAVGNLDSMALPNSITETYSYDALNRLTTVSAGAAFTQTYTLLNNGQRDHVIETRDDGDTVTRTDWTYDALGRLTEETRQTLSTATFEYTDGFAFDLAGNRVTKAHDAAGTTNDENVIYTYNDRDELTAENSDNNANDVTYVYDDNGSQIQKGTVKYVWDLRNRMIGVDANGDNDLADAGDTTYRYDVNGQRVGQTTVPSTGPTLPTGYINDKANPTGYPQVIEETTNGTPTRSYVIGNTILGQSDATAGAYYFVRDGHGSNRALTDTDGVVVPGEVYDYQAFGEAIGFTANSAKTIHLFAGDAEYDGASGFYYHDARWRDTFRFTSEDTYLGNLASPVTLNKYIYCYDSPTSLIDPSGNAPPPWLALGTDAHTQIYSLYRQDHLLNNFWTNQGIPSIAALFKPDIMDFTLGEAAEIKPLSAYGVTTGPPQLAGYLTLLNGIPVPVTNTNGQTVTVFTPIPNAANKPWTSSTWNVGVHLLNLPNHPDHLIFTVGNIGGVIYYADIDASISLTLAWRAARALEQNLQDVVDNFLRGRQTIDESLALALEHQLQVASQVHSTLSLSLHASATTQTALVAGLANMLGIAVLLAVLGRGAPA